MKITLIQHGQTAAYAAEELAKYAAIVTGSEAPAIETVASSGRTGDSIVLALLDDLKLPADDLFDPFIEDILDIDVKNGVGYIAGSNERSILMGVYRYLKAAGCRWIRPGPDGEYLPHCDLDHLCFTYRKKADYPFRGECSEGAISYEHMRDTVFWMPKVGFNMYMIEGLVPYTYMHKWYGHVGNTRLRQKGQITDYGMLEKLIDKLEMDIKKTGVQLHTIGHAWMFEKLGVHHGAGKQEQQELKEEDKKYLALVKGKRDLYGGSTFYTHFCYSNPEARKILVDFWVEYAKKKPYVDFMHVWLADANNNHCECEECVKLEPSDHYVNLLNEIDAALTENGIQSRLVFILYNDTLRPPKKYRLNNPGRFVLLSACGGGYADGYPPLVNAKFEGEEPPYVRNQFVMPSKVLGMKWRKEWKQLSGGKLPSIVFEYRFYCDQYCDPGYMQIARETYRDMKVLGDIDFQGNMSDQTHRNALPTGLPMAVMAETLFDRSVDFDAFTDDYLQGEFGADGAAVRQYLEEITRRFRPNSIRKNPVGIEEAGITRKSEETASWYNNPDLAESLAGIPSLVESFIPTIEKNLAQITDPCQKKSWADLKIHAALVTELSKAYRAGALGDKPKAAEIYTKMIDWLSGEEMNIHTVFDLFLFDRSHRGKFGLHNVGYYD